VFIGPVKLALPALAMAVDRSRKVHAVIVDKVRGADVRRTGLDPDAHLVDPEQTVVGKLMKA